MAKLKPGDRVDCRVKTSTIVSPYRDYDEIKTFEIVASDAHGYYLFVPVYMNINGSVTADDRQCRLLNIDKRFLNEQMVYVQENLIANVNCIMDGMTCCKCGEFYAMSEANQPNGTMICWACRKNPYYK